MKKLRITLLTTIICVALLFSFWFEPFLDTKAPPLPKKLAGYYLMKADFHLHTRFSDGLLSPFSVVTLAKKRGLNVIGLTEHNIVWPGQLARWFSKLTHGPIVLPGQEVTSKKLHYLALGIESAIDWAIPIEEASKQIQEQGGLTIIAHPTKRFWPHLVGNEKYFHATEVVHPIMFAKNLPRNFTWQQMQTFFQNKNLAPIGSTDYHHFTGYMGSIYTWVFAKENSATAVLSAIREKRTLVVDKDGKLYGDQNLKRLIKDSGFQLSRPSSTLPVISANQQVFTALALLCLFFLLILGYHQPSE